jgi:hypothetical protein
MAVVVVVAAGIGGWKWLVPVAVTLALPVPWSSGLSVLVAMIPLAREAALVSRAAPSAEPVSLENSPP